VLPFFSRPRPHIPALSQLEVGVEIRPLVRSVLVLSATFLCFFLSLLDYDGFTFVFETYLSPFLWALFPDR